MNGYTIQITRFHDARSPIGSPMTLSWPDLCRLMSRPMVSNQDKLNLPMWSPATFKPGARRGRANVVNIGAVVLDFDDGTSIQAVHDAWQDWPHVIHTSWSHEPWLPKFRLVVPLEHPRLPEEWPRIWHWANSRTPADKQCKDASRAYFLPAIREPDWPFESMVWDEPSRLLDVRADELPPTPDEIEAERRRTRPAPRYPASKSGNARRDALKNDRGAREAMADRLGAKITGKRADGITCPKCGDSTVWFWLEPGRQSGAECKHRNSCGWTGWLDQLAP